MKDKFKREFGATIEDFFDEKDKDSAAANTKDSVSNS